MKQASSQSEKLFTQEMIEILRRACEAPDTRSAAINDPRSLLLRHGIKLADGGELRIYERATVHNMKPPKQGGEVSEPLFERALQQFETLQPPSGWDQNWRDNHGGCPYPTVPYKTKVKVTECLIWGVWVSGKDWVQDVPGTPYGHWDYHTQSFCVLSHEVEKEITECLPYWSAPNP